MVQDPVQGKLPAVSAFTSPRDGRSGGGTTRFRQVLITGASSGIGEGLALHYAAMADKLYLSGRDPARLADVARRCQIRGVTVDHQSVDVRDRKAMAHWIGHCDSQGGLDLVIANAGVSTHTAHGTDREWIQDIFSVNMMGVLNTVEPAIPLMTTRHRGQIAIISSPAGMRGFPSAPYYSASKAAAKAYGEAMRVRHARDGIGISVVLPGFVDSRITAHNRFPMPGKMSATRAAHIIARGLETNRARIAFPFPTYFTAWLLSVLPVAIADGLLGKLPRKE